MKSILVNSITKDEIVANDILSPNGRILITKGSVIQPKHIPQLLNFGIMFINVVDNKKTKAKTSTISLENLKKDMLKSIPDNLHEINENDSYPLRRLSLLINSLVDYVLSNRSMKLSLLKLGNVNEETYEHSIDTAIMALFIGAELHLDRKTLTELGLSALFHDIGKSRIPNDIITKPGKLTDVEYNIIKCHTLYSKDMLSSEACFSEEIIKGAYQHHEKYDGTGYPEGLKGEEISLFARIIAICDVFTALSTKRCYRDKFDLSESYEFILCHSGTDFDSGLVKVFKDTFSIYPIGVKLKLSDNSVGMVVAQNKGLPDRPFLKITSKNRRIQNFILDLATATSITVKDVLP